MYVGVSGRYDLFQRRRNRISLLFTSVVKSARESGLIGRIIEASFGAELAQLNLPKRQVISLNQPVDH